MKKRIVSLLLALVMVLSLVPTTVWAAEDHDGQVRVIVENTTYAKADGAAWDGTLVDKWVDLVPGSSMMDCIVSALGSYSQTGADSGYITEINGLTAGDGGAASGWMGTLNDWFTNVGFADIKAGDKLFAGDVIRVMYTTNGYGADIGGDWNTQSDTSLAALSFSEGVLTPDFASDKTAYTLTLPQGVTGIRMTATASNKNNQVYLTADGTDYRTGIDEIVQDLAMLWNDGYLLAIMNAPYDLTLLIAECDRLDTNTPTIGPVIDPLVVDKHLDRYRRGGRTLTDLAAAYRVPQDDAHQSM